MMKWLTDYFTTVKCHVQKQTKHNKTNAWFWHLLPYLARQWIGLFHSFWDQHRVTFSGPQPQIPHEVSCYMNWNVWESNPWPLGRKSDATTIMPCHMLHLRSPFQPQSAWCKIRSHQYQWLSALKHENSSLVDTYRTDMKHLFLDRRSFLGV